MEFLDCVVMPDVCGEVLLPGSKSISNRALLLAALAQGETTLIHLLDSDDTRVMRGALSGLGVRSAQDSSALRVEGCGGRFQNKSGTIFCGNAGTATRSLIATLALAGGDYTFDGVPRMRERPIGDLVDALRMLGANIAYQSNDGFLPLTCTAGDISIEKPIPARGDVSSQFLTGLLLAMPLVTHAQGKSATIHVVGELISKPYIEITLRMMQSFGVHVVRDGWQRFTVPPARYVSPGTYAIEGDASSASYFLAAGAIAGDVTVRGVGAQALQGDAAFIEPLHAMGGQVSVGPDWLRCTRAHPLRGITFDANAIPDAAMTLVPLALFANGITTITNVASWRVKETDRIAAMATEARKFGATVEAGADFIRVIPPATLQSPAQGVETYDDHRIAMCFALMSLGARGVTTRIHDPKCVNKTFPDFFARFSALASKLA